MGKQVNWAKVGLVVVKFLGLAVAPMALLWWATSFLNVLQLRWLLAGAVYLWPLLLDAGTALGKTEARGVVAGIDTALGKLAAAVDLRDNSRARAAAQRGTEAPRAAQFNVYLPDPAQLAGPIPITQRQIAGSDVVDM